MIQHEDFDSLKQGCSLVIRVQNRKPIEIPITAGMTDEEILKNYPYIMDMLDTKLPVPRVGAYAEYADEEAYQAAKAEAERMKHYWRGKSDASLFEIAMAIAVDVQLRGINYVGDVFKINVLNSKSADPTQEPVTESETIAPVRPEDLTDRQAEAVLRSHGLMEPERRESYEETDEQDVALGVGGNLSVSFYHDDITKDYMSDPYDALESRLEYDDEFKKVVSQDISNDEKAKIREEHGISEPDAITPEEAEPEIKPAEQEEPVGLDNDLATDDEPQTAFSNSDEDRLSDVIPDGAVLSDIPEELLGDPIDDEPSDVFSEDPMEEPTDDGIRMPDFYGSGSSIADQLAMEMGLGLSFEDNENSGDKSDAKPQESKNDLAGFSSDDDDDSHVFS